MNPLPLTFWELSQADFGKAEAAWDHTATLLAMLANTVRDGKRHPAPYHPKDFHPLRERERQQAKSDAPDDMSAIREVLLKCQRTQAQ